jgi:phosphoserine phosphatase RsbU/P
MAGGTHTAETRGLVAGLAIVTALALLDLSSSVSFFGALVLGVVVASLFCRPKLTVIVGAYAIAWVMLLGAPEHWTQPHFFRIFLGLAGSAVAVAGSYARIRREEALVRMSRVAEAAQLALLRPIPPVLDRTQFAVRYLSASQDALVGGDFYDAASTSHGVRIIVGDVVGKGLDAVGAAAIVLGAFREAVFDAPTLGELASRLDATMTAQIGGDEFATAVLVEISDGSLRIASCGHPPPIMRASDGSVGSLEIDSALPLGLGARPEVTTFGLMGGERLLLYTDGIAESRDQAGVFFDLHTATDEALASDDPEAALDVLISRLHTHTGGHLRDDVALVLAAMT